MTSALTRSIARLLLPPTFIVALAILVKGYSDVGDGFAAGVLASLGILLQYLALGRNEVERLLPVRLAAPCAVAGLLLALLVAFLPVLGGDPPLTHVPKPDASVVQLGTFELVSAVAFDVGVFLLVLGAVTGIVRTLVLARAGRAS